MPVPVVGLDRDISTNQVEVRDGEVSNLTDAQTCLELGLEYGIMDKVACGSVEEVAPLLRRERKIGVPYLHLSTIFWVRVEESPYYILVFCQQFCHQLSHVVVRLVPTFWTLIFSLIDFGGKVSGA